MSDDEDIEMGEDTQLARQQNSVSFLSEADLDDQFPNRPRNQRPTWPFHTLFQRLFDPLLENRKRPVGPAVKARAKVGPHGPFRRSPAEQKRVIVSRFISKWREEVGSDVYPAFRLIVPDRDRDRAMYGLKEKTIGRILVKVMKIDKNSEDGFNLLNWKLPGQYVASRMAGDFAGRCYEIISKRPYRHEVGNMTIDEVNELLDRLSQASGEKAQMKIFEHFYTHMNSTELMWLVRMILRQMKIGATERTLFSVWHPDAEDLFSVSSSLRRVCWDLFDPAVRLEPDDRGVALMQCFQPQLAQFSMHSFDRLIAKMRPTEEDREFWIEEKLDGERMQLHMASDPAVAGGKRFAFWSRKAKEYTYLYGNGLNDPNAALTRHLQNAFDDRVDNIILDGEMVTWDPSRKAVLPFGTLKSAAIDQQKETANDNIHRPLYRIFDILYLNGRALTGYTLRDRRKALSASVMDVTERFEVHKYTVATGVDVIEPRLREVVEKKAEGLVLKNPRSAYSLGERNDDWIKVKPEYMEEFGESLDCIVVGGYYGSGHRGGNLSSFLCGLILKRKNLRPTENPQKCWSFFKVGGGFTAQDYANIRHQTDGKWKEWNAQRPPTDWIELGGGDLQYERPDVWIKPEDSVVLEVKAASVNDTDSFRTSKTLRFPRFRKLRTDRDWTNALSVDEFAELAAKVSHELNEKKQFKIDNERRKRARRTDDKKTVRVAGGTVDDVKTPYAGPETKIFDGMAFFVMSESLAPNRCSKAEIEQLIKANGGTIRQTHDAIPKTVCIADKRVVKAAALLKRGDLNIVRPKWLFDCVRQAKVDQGRPGILLPYEPSHMLFTVADDAEGIGENVDQYGDSYARDISVDELRHIFESMDGRGPEGEDGKAAGDAVREQLEEHGHQLEPGRGWIFESLRIYFDRGSSGSGRGGGGSGNERKLDAKLRALQQAQLTARFAGAAIAEELVDDGITHVVTGSSEDETQEIREKLAQRRRPPRIVSVDWIERSWEAGTRLDEERFGA